MSFCWETQHTALVIVTVREVLKQIISRKSDKQSPLPPVCVRRCCQSKAVLDGSRMAKHPPAGNENEAEGRGEGRGGGAGPPAWTLCAQLRDRSSDLLISSWVRESTGGNQYLLSICAAKAHQYP